MTDIELVQRLKKLLGKDVIPELHPNVLQGKEKSKRYDGTSFDAGHHEDVILQWDGSEDGLETPLSSSSPVGEARRLVVAAMRFPEENWSLWVALALFHDQYGSSWKNKKDQNESFQDHLYYAHACRLLAVEIGQGPVVDILLDMAVELFEECMRRHGAQVHILVPLSECIMRRHRAAWRRALPPPSKPSIFQDGKYTRNPSACPKEKSGMEALGSSTESLSSQKTALSPTLGRSAERVYASVHSERGEVHLLRVYALLSEALRQHPGDPSARALFAKALRTHARHSSNLQLTSQLWSLSSSFNADTSQVIREKENEISKEKEEKSAREGALGIPLKKSGKNGTGISGSSLSRHGSPLVADEEYGDESNRLRAQKIHGQDKDTAEDLQKLLLRFKSDFDRSDWVLKELSLFADRLRNAIALTMQEAAAQSLFPAAAATAASVTTTQPTAILGGGRAGMGGRSLLSERVQQDQQHRRQMQGKESEKKVQVLKVNEKAMRDVLLLCTTLKRWRAWSLTEKKKENVKDALFPDELLLGEDQYATYFEALCSPLQSLGTACHSTWAALLTTEAHEILNQAGNNSILSVSQLQQAQSYLEQASDQHVKALEVENSTSFSLARAVDCLQMWSRYSKRALANFSDERLRSFRKVCRTHVQAALDRSVKASHNVVRAAAEPALQLEFVWEAVRSFEVCRELCAHEEVAIRSVQSIDTSIAGVLCSWGSRLLAQVSTIDPDSLSDQQAAFTFVEDFLAYVSVVHPTYAAQSFNLGVLFHHQAVLAGARGDVASLRSCVEQAATHYQRAVEIHPRYASALYNWGCAFQLLATAELAEERSRQAAGERTAVDHYLGAALKYCRASQVDPNLVEPLVNLGTCFLGIVLSETASLVDRVECFKVARALWLETQMERGRGRLDYLTEVKVKTAAAILRTLQGDAELGNDPDQADMAKRLQKVELLTQPVAAEQTARDAVIPRKEGYLTKRGAFVKSWKRRYFVLDAIKLSYYTGEDKRQRRGIIRLGELSGCEPNKRNSVSHKRFYFDVFTHSRVWNFYADSVQDMREWVQVIRQCCDT